MVSTAPLTPRVFRALFDPSRAVAAMARAAVGDAAPDIYHAPLKIDAAKFWAISTNLPTKDFRAWCVRNRASGSTAFRLIDEDWASLHALGVSSWVTAARFAMWLDLNLQMRFYEALVPVLSMKVEGAGASASAAEDTLTVLAMALLRRTGTPCVLHETDVGMLDGVANRPDCAAQLGSTVGRAWPLRLAIRLARDSELPTVVRFFRPTMGRPVVGQVIGEHGTSPDTMQATILVASMELLGREVTASVLHELHHWSIVRDLARDARAIAVRPNEQRTLNIRVGHVLWNPPEDLACDPICAEIFAWYRCHSLDEITAYFLSARYLLRSAGRCHGGKQRRERILRRGILEMRMAQSLLERDLLVLGGAVAALYAGEMEVRVVMSASPTSPKFRADRVLRLPSDDWLLFHSAQLNRGRSTEDHHDRSLDPVRVGAVLQEVDAALRALQPRMAHTRAALEVLTRVKTRTASH